MFRNLNDCVFFYLYVAWVVIVLDMSVFYCMVAHCRGEGTTPSQTGHMTFSNKEPGVPHTHTHTEEFATLAF